MRKFFLFFLFSSLFFYFHSFYNTVSRNSSVRSVTDFTKKEINIDKSGLKGILHEYFRNDSRGEILVYTRFSSKPNWQSQKIMDVKATAYTPGPESCGIYADGFTFTEMIADHGIIAVDPREIKLGSIVYVEKYGFAYAADIGGKIKGKRIDLCFRDVDTALKFGIKDVKLVKLY